VGDVVNLFSANSDIPELEPLINYILGTGTQNAESLQSIKNLLQLYNERDNIDEALSPEELDAVSYYVANGITTIYREIIDNLSNADEPEVSLEDGLKRLARFCIQLYRLGYRSHQSKNVAVH
jgi:hypothetical protein